MFTRRIFDTKFQVALEEELRRQDMTIRELADKTGIPAPTLYKITSGERDPRLSTVKKIKEVLDPDMGSFIAVIAVKYLLDEVEGKEVQSGPDLIPVKGYGANSFEECIIAAIRAEKNGACAIVCAPILASLIEKIVDIPVAIIKPSHKSVNEAINSVSKRI